MEIVVLLAACLVLGIKVLLLRKSQRDELRCYQEKYLTGLSEALRAAEAIKNDCLAVHSELQNRHKVKPQGRGPRAAERYPGARRTTTNGRGINGATRRANRAGAKVDTKATPEDVIRQPAVVEYLPHDAGAPAADDSVWMGDVRSPAKPARRSKKKKIIRREARRPSELIMPMNGVYYNAGASKSPSTFTV
jgi:hypothetical protein